MVVIAAPQDKPAAPAPEAKQEAPKQEPEKKAVPKKKK